MNPVMAQQPARSEFLDIPISQAVWHHPFWHRDEPVVAVTRLDPEHAAIRRHFPESWGYLVRAKALLDSVTALDQPAVVPDDDQHFEQISPLLNAAAEMLSRFAEAERGAAAQAVVRHAHVAAKRLTVYAQTREWKTVTLFEPGPDTPWLYCGPINTWSTRDVRSPIAFLVTAPSAALQPEIEEVDARVDDIRAETARILRAEVKAIQVRPTMHITDLLLAGGESVSGHKNFAHFFPLEAAGSTVLGPEFTVVFANVHRARFRRCSLELLKEVRGFAGDVSPDESLRMSLRWFRCHDLGHFWRRADVPGKGRTVEGITHFERMALEEAYADIVGLLTARSLGAEPALDTAFTAELIRYLSRRYDRFADSTAAMLTLGWIQEQTAVYPAKVGLRDAVSALEDLVRVLHGVLWDADPSGIGRLRAALGKGSEYQEIPSAYFHTLPTDISYTFG